LRRLADRLSLAAAAGADRCAPAPSALPERS
jgi:hypothetical protein